MKKTVLIIIFIAMLTGIGTTLFFLHNKNIEAFKRNAAIETGDTSKDTILIDADAQKEQLDKNNKDGDQETDSDDNNDSQTILATISSLEGFDQDFATWLLEQYQDATKEIYNQIQNNTYEAKSWYLQTGKSIFVLKDEYNGLLDSEETMKQNNIYQKTCADSEAAKLTFAGDVSFANDYTPAQNYTAKGIDGAFSKDLQATMKEADIFMINNEFCYTTSTAANSAKGYCFKADPSTVNRLDEMGVDIVSVANNHLYDFGEQGFIDTIDTLDKANMPYVGGGHNLEEAKNNIVYFIANGIKIAYIAATQVELDAGANDEAAYTKPATDTRAGVIRCYDPTMVNDMIKDAKTKADFVIVYPHWGHELVQELQPDEQKLAYSFIDAGADAIIGGHPHVVQGAEYYKDVPIFYSLGNFSFSSKVRDVTMVSLVVTIDGIKSARFVPAMENSGITIKCDKGDSNYNRIMDQFHRYSSDTVAIDEDGYISQTN